MNIVADDIVADDIVELGAGGGAEAEAGERLARRAEVLAGAVRGTWRGAPREEATT